MPIPGSLLFQGRSAPRASKSLRSRLDAEGLVLLVFGAAVLAGCENKCDELVKTLADCEGSDVGATTETTDTTIDPQGDAECSGTDAACAACVLESKHDLCLDYGAALAECRTAGQCE